MRRRHSPKAVSALAWALFACALAFSASAAQEEETPRFYNVIVLQGLNKVTGHISRFSGPTGSSLRFGNLEIVARRCWKSAPEDRPENAGLLDVTETRSGEAPQRIFLGWMFSSSPGLSGLEHPVYDITVLDCQAKNDAENDAETPAQDKPKNTKRN